MDNMEGFLLINLYSLLLITFINIIFFCKKRLHQFEDDLYGRFILISTFMNAVGLILGFAVVPKYNVPMLIQILLNKFYLVTLLLWINTLTMYTLYISRKDSNKNFARTEKKFKYFNILNIFLALVLPISLSIQGNSAVPSGIGMMYSYSVFTIEFILQIFIVLRHPSNVKNKKFIPVILLSTLGTAVMINQIINPNMNYLINPLFVFIAVVMYHTIENPDLKQLEEVTKNNEITEQAYIDKSNFIFEMTQEVREPLNYIKNTSKELLDNDRKKEEYQEGLNYIYNASRQLDFVVNDVLNVSSLDVQKVKILNNRYNLDMIYDDLVKRIENSVNNNVEFRHTIPSKVPYLYGDNIKLKQILYSILMDSVKKTEKGFIEFNIGTIEKYDVCRVIFRITDSGVGIGIDKINEILSTTSELNKEDIVNLEKSEFNIKLCQKIIKSLGGNMLIKSKLGKGTEVILTIDQKIYREKEDKNNNLFNSYSNKRVLVVNQDKKVNEIIKKVFNESDINASYMLYGADAIDRIKSGKKYDYIIIEDDMKEMSGYETLKKLKEISKFNIPCIVVLDSNKENIKKHYLEDGFSDYILTSDLRNELKRIMEKY